MERLNKLAAFQRKALQHAFLCELVHFFLSTLFYYHVSSMVISISIYARHNSIGIKFEPLPNQYNTSIMDKMAA